MFAIVLFTRFVFFLILPVVTAVPIVTAQGHYDDRQASSQSLPDLPPAEALKECLKRSDHTGKCLDGLFREFLQTHSTTQALELLRRYESTESELRLGCHPVAHAIGRETFRLKGTIHDSFAACDQTCHSGCYHGVVERFLLGGATDVDTSRHVSLADLRRKANVACNAQASLQLRFQCLHGLGHAIMYFSHYQLREALLVCDALPDEWSRSSCYGGVFMENVFSATPDKRDVSPTDYHHPCSRVDPKYRSDCYTIQTWRMMEMGLSTDRLFEECRKADSYQIRCMESIGRDLSNDVRIKEPRLAAEKCELVDGEGRQACIRGVVYALIDNTWDGRYGLPFCTAARAADDVAYCFRVGTNYLKAIYEKSKDDIENECKKYLVQPQSCFDAIVR